MNNIRRKLLDMLEDFNYCSINIIERIVYLREIMERYKYDKVLAAKELINIYSPLGSRLCISKLKWELEDFCFYYLYSNEYRKISKLLHERRIDRERYINDFVLSLRHFMLLENITAEIYGRPKHIYSIWRKMQKKSVSFDELFDVRGVRIIVEHLQDSYYVLDILHSHFRYLPNEFDNYVDNPKPNGYQSIHTVVLGPNNKTIEIQIRTKQMHKNAELGIAAHWKYKNGSIITQKKSSYENHII